MHPHHTLRVLRHASLAMVFGLLVTAGSSVAQAPFCVPSCDASDGRMLAITPGQNLATLTDTVLELRIAVDISATQFDLGFFDGDISLPHWDVCALSCGSPTTQYRLYADPFNDGTGTFLVTTFDAGAMPDNGWADFTVVNVPEAQSASGMYYYRLEIELLADPLADPKSAVLNTLKVRASEDATLEIFGRPFAFIAAITGVDDASILYPSFPAADPTTFDGTFSFFLDLTDPTDEDFDLDHVTVWDGDLDFGSFDCVDNDTDDPNSPLLPRDSIQGFPTTPDPASEGVASGNLCASGSGFTTGAPADDADSSGFGALFHRSPSIRYDLLKWSGDGTQELVASNNNPSGNSEWEKFRVDTSPSADPDGPPDAVVSSLSEGIYEVRVQGLDLQNLNAFHFERVMCIDSLGNPCPAPPPSFCGVCNGKINAISFRYLGTATAQVTVVGKRGTTFFDAPVAPGGWFDVVGPGRGALSTQITIYVDGQFHDAIHTSCSDPIGPGQTFGDFRVVGGQSTGGGPLCPSRRCEVNGGSLSFQGSDVTWQLSNVGLGPATIKQIDLEWPGQNGTLQQLTLGSTTFWTGNEGSPAMLREGWNDAYQDRQLVGGATEPLVLGFANTAATDPGAYTLRVTFLESCSVELQAGSPLTAFALGEPTSTTTATTSDRKKPGKGR